MRTSEIYRKTKETDIKVKLSLDGNRKIIVDTGIGFFDHMLSQLGFHGGFDLEISCAGDTFIDSHHTVEDVGLALGTAFREALGENPSIQRFGSAFAPMDETLSRVVIDISGRPFTVFNAELPAAQLGTFETETASEFFRAFAQNALITVHLDNLTGRNTHHILESLFKAFGQALSAAVRLNDGQVPSTKGML